MIDISFTLIDLSSGLIPTQPEGGCPKHSLHKANYDTCTCMDDHCSWDLCRLQDAPMTCLNGTHSKWKWAKIKQAWVANIQSEDDQGISDINLISRFDRY